jgi:hypothetical protein
MLIGMIQIALIIAAAGVTTAQAKDDHFENQLVGTDGHVTQFAPLANRPPVVKRLIGNRRAQEGSLFKYRIPGNIFADPDGDSMTIRIQENVDWLSANQRRRTLSGTPLTFDNPAVVRVRATDEHGASVTASFRVSIRPRIVVDDASPAQSTKSPNEDGTEDSFDPSISSAGRFVAHVFLNFNQDFARLEPSIVVRDFTSPTPSGLGSLTVAGPRRLDPGDGTRALFSSPSISADGRMVAFVGQTPPDSSSPGVEIRVVRIVDGHPLRLRTVFAHSILRSDDPDTRGVLVDAADVSLSADGRFLAFEQGTDIVVAKIGTRRQLVINDASSPSISGNGGRLAYEEVADLERRIFVATLNTNNMTEVETVEAGFDIDSEFGPLPSNPVVSVNGRFVAFESDAGELVPGDSNGARDVFVYNIGEPLLSRVSVDADGDQASGDSGSPSLSGDGRRVAFINTIVDAEQVVVRELDLQGQARGELRIASINTDRVLGSGFSFEPALSADGRFVTFTSSSTNLTADAQDNRGTAVFLVPAFPDYAPVVDIPLDALDEPSEQTLVLGEPTGNEISPTFDADEYRVELIEGQTYRFVLQADGSNGTPLGDPYLEIYSPFGELLASDDDSGGGLNGLDALLSFLAPSSETGDNAFFVAVRGVGDATGDYLLSGDLSPPAATAAR